MAVPTRMSSACTSPSVHWWDEPLDDSALADAPLSDENIPTKLQAPFGSCCRSTTVSSADAAVAGVFAGLPTRYLIPCVAATRAKRERHLV
jgi:hypothetical protein